MSRLQINVLGGLSVSLEGQAVVNFYSDKVRALLAYLVIEADKSHMRSQLMGLLWPEFDEKKARNSLRQALFHLRKAISDSDAEPSHLITTNKTVQWNRASDYALDVHAFDAALNKANGVDEAIALYQADLLDGFLLSSCQAFDEWMMMRREAWRRELLMAFELSVAQKEQRGQLREAISLAHRWLRWEPWEEEAHRTLMRCHFALGDTQTAVSQYQQCTERLRSELGIEPSAETQALYAEIAQTVERSKLPVMPSPFIGRRQEIAAIQKQLTDPHVRLLTIVGMGGTGKTRLALEVGRQSERQAYFVNLTGISENEAHLATALTATIGNAVEGSQFGKQPSQEALFKQIGNQPLLLILDNFEHLLVGKGARQFVVELLANCPQIQCIVTSRQRLTLQSEHIFSLHGMAFADTSIQSEAAQLFVSYARQKEPAFAPNTAEQQLVTQLCNLVEGMPLAIELLTSWLPNLTLAEMVDEVNQGLDIFQSDQIDMPSRHRSVTAVCHTSVQRLTPEEQKVFYQLAVFRGGFDRLAAKQITQAPPTILARLVELSLLRRDKHGRYTLHELLRQYGDARLQGDSRRDALHRHAHFYADLAKTLDDDLQTERFFEVMKRFTLEYENMISALHTSLKSEQVELLIQLSVHLTGFWETRGLLTEGRDWISKILPRCHDYRAEKAKLLLKTAVFAKMQSDLDEARTQIEKARTIYQIDQNLKGVAQTFLEEASIHYDNGDLEKSQIAAEEGMALAQQVNDTHLIAQTHNMMGRIALDHKETDKGQHHFETAVKFIRETSDVRLSAVMLNNLAVIHLRRENIEAAKLLLQESIIMREKVQDIQGIGLVSWNLGTVYFEEKEFTLSYKSYLNALEMFYKTGAYQRMFSVMGIVATVPFAIGDVEPAIILCAASETLCKQYGVSRLQNCVAHFASTVADLRQAASDAQFQASWQLGELMSLEKIMAYAKNIFRTSDSFDQGRKTED